MAKRKVEGRAGQPVVIGGAEDREGDRGVLSEFVRLAGGQRARIAARGFGRLILKEDEDLRGRRPGEVTGLMKRVIDDEAPGLDCAVVTCEEEALRGELRRLGPDEIVVMFYDKSEPVRRVLAEFGAEPAETIEGLAPRDEAKAAAAAEQAAPFDAASAPLVGVRRARTAARRNPAQDRQGYVGR